MSKLTELILDIGEWFGLEQYQTQYTIKFVIAFLVVTYAWRVIMQGKI